MAGTEENDTEITLGMGKLLGIFFGLVILCGISLGVGYSLGRGSAKQAAAAAITPPPAAANPSPTAGNKPGAAQVAQPKTPDCTTGDNCPPQAGATSTSDLTFYQAVQQKDAHPQLTPPPSTANPSPHTGEAHGTLGTGYLVQIAAVRNQDDAKLLSDALQKQQFPVIIAQPGDKLFHVQVGPYPDIKEAEAIRLRLVSAGYNAFLKR